MPLTHTRTFRVRYYECNASGQVSSANYLRYMQEAAFDASAAAGYDMDRYHTLGRFWLARETEIEHLAPLRYGDSVETKTWVADFRKIRSRRAYELRITRSGELAARAHTDWVYLNRATGRPTQIEAEMILAFSPEGAPELAVPHSRFPAAPAPPAGVFRLIRRVDPRDLDQVGHVNNAVYLEYLEDCGARALAAHGWSEERLLSRQAVPVARKHRIEYRQPALLDDELEVATWGSAVSQGSMVRHFTVTRSGDGALVARARTLLIWIDRDTARLAAIPGSFLHDLSPNTVGAPSRSDPSRPRQT
jgi:acyl-CoA thioester hydrolase